MPKSAIDPGRRTGVSFWTASIIGHLVLFGVLLLTPAREILFPEKDPEQEQPPVADDALEEISEAIRSNVADQLAARVNLLKQGQQRMATNERIYSQRFEPFGAIQQRGALERFEAHSVSIVQRQQRILEVYATARPDRGLTEAAGFALTQKVDLEIELEEIQRALYLLPVPAEVRLAQTEADAQQREALNHHLWAFELMERIARTITTIEALEAQLPEARESFRLADEAATRSIEQHLKLQDDVKAADARVEAIGNKREVREQRDEARRERNEIADRMNQAGRVARDARRNRERAFDALGSLEQTLSTQKESLERLRGEREGRLRTARNVQQGALHRQKEVIEKVRAALEAEADRAAANEPDGSARHGRQPWLPASALLAGLGPHLGWAQTLEAAPPAEAAMGQRLLKLYDDSVVTMEEVCEDYRRIRAMQLARLRDVPFQQAYESISSVMPVLDPIDREIIGKRIRDPNDVKPHREEVIKVQDQVEMMIELTAMLLLEIERIEAELAAELEEEDLTLEEIVQLPEFDPEAELQPELQEVGETRETQPVLEELEELARDNEAQQAVDLSPIMRELYNVEDLTQEAIEEATRRARMQRFDTTDIVERLRGTIRAENFDFGRKVLNMARPREWLFIDTWYIIGPFDNVARVNLNKAFPPETVIDLDATYIGKDGREVRWDFTQARDRERPGFTVPRNAEEYGIWYGYTEIYLDEARDLWVAVGSDDKSNIWLNDLPIFESGDQLKGWRPDERFIKVSFKSGINRILIRLENGWLQTGFSFGIHTAAE